MSETLLWLHVGGVSNLEGGVRWRAWTWGLGGQYGFAASMASGGEATAVATMQAGGHLLAKFSNQNVNSF